MVADNGACHECGSYSPEELMRVALACVKRCFFLPDDARDDAVSAFVMAALEAEKKAKPGRGMRSFQHQAGLWAAKQFVRKWSSYRKQMAVSLECLATLSDRTNDSADIDDDENDSEALVDHDAQQPLDRLLQAEQTEMLKNALAKLPPKQRKAIRLRFEQDMSLEKMAKKLGITASYASQLLAEALSRLRVAMADSFVPGFGSIPNGAKPKGGRKYQSPE